MLTQSDHWIFYIWSSQTEGYISVAGCPGTLNCGRPARVPRAATVISFIEQGVVSAGRAGGWGFGLLLEAQPKMMRVMKYRVVRTY